MTFKSMRIQKYRHRVSNVNSLGGEDANDENASNTTRRTAAGDFVIIYRILIVSHLFAYALLYANYIFKYIFGYDNSNIAAAMTDQR